MTAGETLLLTAVGGRRALLRKRCLRILAELSLMRGVKELIVNWVMGYFQQLVPAAVAP
jgi:hypothetical protein